MSWSDNLPKYLVMAVLVGGGGAMLASQFSGNDAARPTVAVTVPMLGAAATQGQVLFEENCIACHGKNAAGTGSGPPLVHKYYEPNHHGDQAFVLAVSRGVRAHHWRFGSMPPVPGVSVSEVGLITRYVRELQRANGIN